MVRQIGKQLPDALQAIIDRVREVGKELLDRLTAAMRMARSVDAVAAGRQPAWFRTRIWGGRQ
jgi:hypothetical protein